MKKILKCGCVRGYHYCPEAIRLWNLFCIEYQKIMTTRKELDCKKGKRLFREYENHFIYRHEGIFDSISMKEWKKLMGYDTLIYKIKKIFWSIIRPYKKGKT